jgi:hypothetical protein
MRGVKGSYYDGGHRVPFFVRWPRGGLAGGRDVTEMALGIDLLPTLADLCGLPLPAGVVPDGRSFAPLLRGECAAFADDRFEFLQFRQSTAPPEKWDSAVLTRRWRLVRGEELYDIAADPGQREDVAARHPDVVARLRDAHEAWWAEIAPGLEEPCPISLGTDAENPTTLCAMDVLGDVAWSQPHIAEARRTTGCWAVRFERPGRYRFALRRWPEELGLALDAALAAEDAARLCAQTPVRPPVALHPVRARLGFAGREWRAAVRPGDVAAVFETDVARAETTRLEAWFADAAGAESGAYYVAVERLGA